MSTQCKPSLSVSLKPYDQRGMDVPYLQRDGACSRLTAALEDA